MVEYVLSICSQKMTLLHCYPPLWEHERSFRSCLVRILFKVLTICVAIIPNQSEDIGIPNICYFYIEYYTLHNISNPPPPRAESFLFITLETPSTTSRVLVCLCWKKSKFLVRNIIQNFIENYSLLTLVFKYNKYIQQIINHKGKL